MTAVVRPGCQILGVRGLQGHTVSRRRFNLFKLLRRHLPAVSLERKAVPRRAGHDRGTSSKDRRSACPSHPANTPPETPRPIGRQARPAERLRRNL